MNIYLMKSGLGEAYFWKYLADGTATVTRYYGHGHPVVFSAGEMLALAGGVSLEFSGTGVIMKNGTEGLVPQASKPRLITTAEKNRAMSKVTYLYLNV